MAEKIAESIVLKVGMDAGGLEREVIGIGQAVDTTEKNVKKLKGTLKDGSKEFKKLAANVGKTDNETKKLNTDVDKLEKGFDGLTESLKKYNKEGKKSKGLNISNSLKGIAAIGAAATIAGVASRMRELNKTGQDAERLGIARNELLKLQGVAEKFGATAEDMVQGLKNINELGSIALLDGQGAKFDAFKELNIDLVTFNKLNPSEQMEVFAKALSGVTNQGDKTRLRLELMQEEGVKLSGTMEELAVNADGAKSSIMGIDSALSPEKIKETNERLSELNNRLKVTQDFAVGLALDTFDFFEEPIRKSIFAMHGLNVAQEEYNDSVNAAILLGAKNAAQARKAIKEREQAAKNDIQLQKDHEQFVKDSLADIEKDKLARENNPNSPANIAFKKLQEKAVAEKKAASDKVAEDKKAAETEIKRRKKVSEQAQNTINKIALLRKKDLIKELKEGQERSKIGGAGAIEAGSAEAQQIDASLKDRDQSAGRIKKLSAEVKTTEKANQEKSLKVAEDTLDEIKKLNKKKPIIIPQRGI